MPPKKSKSKPTTPTRRSTRKKSTTVPKSTQIKAVNSRDSPGPDTRLPVPSVEPDIDPAMVDSLGAGDLDAEVEMMGSGGADEEIDEIDEIDEIGELGGLDALDALDEIDELDELESSILFSKASTKVSVQQSDGSVSVIAVVDISEGNSSSPAHDPEVEEFFDDALRATKHEPARESNPTPKSLKLKLKPQHAPKPAVSARLDCTHRKKASKQAPDITHKIDISDLVVPSTIKARAQLPGGTRELEFERGCTFWDFKYRASDVFGQDARYLKLAYSTNATKRDRRFVVSEAEFKSMIKEIVNHFDRHIKAIRSERLKDAAAAHNARKKGRVYAPKPSKEIPDIGLMIYNLPSGEEDVAGKSVGKAKGGDSRVKEPKPGSLSTRSEQIREKIEQNACKECKQPCVLLPRADAEPEHVPLEPEQTDLWIDQAAKARGLCSVCSPPTKLLLTLSDASSARKRKHTNPDESAPPPKKPLIPGPVVPQYPSTNPNPNYHSHIGQIYLPPVPYQHPQMGMPLPYYTGPYYTPPSPYPMFPGYNAQVAPFPYPTSGIMGSGPFPQYQPAYPAYRHPPSNEQKKITIFMRLMTYVREDQPLIDPGDEEKSGAQPEAGPSKSK
ncbi:hypothetical protein FRC11_011016 [Ceratobasidium sp. 423]|nr:hypothetical protein FRC11_011016 [Ceratobasidium sp. 423]